MLIGDNFGHETRNTGAHINRRIMITVGKCAGKYDMPIQNTAHCVRNRLVRIVSLHQNRIYTCNGAFVEIPTALQQLR